MDGMIEEDVGEILNKVVNVSFFKGWYLGLEMNYKELVLKRFERRIF